MIIYVINPNTHEVNKTDYTGHLLLDSRVVLSVSQWNIPLCNISRSLIGSLQQLP